MIANSCGNLARYRKRPPVLTLEGPYPVKDTALLGLGNLSAELIGSSFLLSHLLALSRQIDSVQCDVLYLLMFSTDTHPKDPRISSTTRTMHS